MQPFSVFTGIIHERKFLSYKEETMKRLLYVILTIAVLLSAATAFAYTDGITVLVDSEPVEFDVEPMIENDRVLVPLRAIFEALGAGVEWDGGNQTVTSVKDDITVTLTIGSDTLYKNDEAITLDAAACIVDDRTLVPTRAAAEAFGCDVQWDGETKTVIITANSGAEAALKPTEAPYIDDTFEQKLLSYMPDDENYMISPFSLKIALAMAANGANDETRDEILKVIDVNDINTFNEYYKSFIKYISTADGLNADEDNRLPVFELANSIWLNRDYADGQFADIEFSDEFSQIIADYYDGASDIAGNTDKLEKSTDGSVKKRMEKLME